MVTHGNVRHRFRVGLIEFAVGRRERAFGATDVRLAGDEVHHAAGGVTAEQRALRTFQDLDALHVEQAEAVRQARSLVHAVDVDANGSGLVGIERGAADAAQEDLRRREAEDRMPHQVRRLRAEIAADEGVPRGQFLTAVGGDGLRYRTQGFDAPARGNDDLFDRRGDGLPGSAYCKNGGSDCAPRPYRRRQSPVHGYPPAVVQRRNRYTAGYGVAMDF